MSFDSNPHRLLFVTVTVLTILYYRDLTDFGTTRFVTVPLSSVMTEKFQGLFRFCCLAPSLMLGSGLGKGVR